ncbi:MAG TPA: M23 family metallopeptidase, partial [Ignavibacteria bacterium]|nr:M23 family metallopeptidase [Ignavibacteria bacterium]
NLNTPLDAGLLITGFGNYMNNITNTISFNSGIDYSVAKGSKVYAVAGGVASIVGKLPFFGTCVIIKHENGYRTVYASLSETNVIAGDFVKLNQVIGKTGETLEGQMFHFELWKDASPLNSNEWFRR